MYAVIDLGSGLIKAGLTDQDPNDLSDHNLRCIFSSVVGGPRTQSAMPSSLQKQVYCGEEAIAKRNDLNLKYPINIGVV